MKNGNGSGQFLNQTIQFRSEESLCAKFGGIVPKQLLSESADLSNTVSIAFTPGCFHSYVLVNGELEFHSRLFHNRTHSKEIVSGAIKAGLLFVIRNLSDDEIQKVRKSIEKFRGNARTLNCVTGVVSILKESGIQFKNPSFDPVFLRPFLIELMTNGLYPAKNPKVALKTEWIKLSSKSFEELERIIKKSELKYGLIGLSGIPPFLLYRYFIRRNVDLVKMARIIKHNFFAPYYWFAHTLDNTWGIINVFDLAWLRRLPGGLLSLDHPFSTGLDPNTNSPIWHKNVVYRSPRKRNFADSDDEIITSVMTFLKNMVRFSAEKKATRMPPAINYIHGCVHYNGISLIFDDFKDAVQHFTDPTFRNEMMQMIREEKREPTIIFRDRDFDKTEFAIFSCFMKSIFPYFGNPNGNKGRIHWGTPSPFPAFNLITGNWIKDTRSLMTRAGRMSVARSPVTKTYFVSGPYLGGWDYFMFPERYLSWITNIRIQMRGDRGGIYFVDKRKLDAGYRFDPDQLPKLSDRLKEKAVEGIRFDRKWVNRRKVTNKKTDSVA